jgi:recombinational DNA repair protein (RecF pathway)
VAAREATVLAETWALVTALGFGPSLDRCVGCGVDLAAEGDFFLDYAAGGLCCGQCDAGAGGGRTGLRRD